MHKVNFQSNEKSEEKDNCRGAQAICLADNWCEGGKQSETLPFSKGEIKTIILFCVCKVCSNEDPLQTFPLLFGEVCTTPLPFFSPLSSSSLNHLTAQLKDYRDNYKESDFRSHQGTTRQIPRSNDSPRSFIIV